MKSLLAAGLVRETAYEGCKFWELSEQGKEVGVQNLSVGVTGPTLGLHNIAFKFKLGGVADIRLKKSIPMRHWTRYQCFLDGHNVELTTKHLLIWPIRRDERIWGKDAFFLRQRARDKAISIAQVFAARYKLTLGPPEISRRPHFGVMDPVAKQLDARGIQVSNELGGNDDSLHNGSGELDLYTPESGDAYIRLPGKVAHMENTLERVAEQMAVIADQEARTAAQMGVYAEHLKAHTTFIKGAASIMKKLDARLSQRSLGEFA
jgi:hypothetical protein